jgi:integrase
VLPVPIQDITPQFLDRWIDSLRATVGKYQQSHRRCNFEHELTVMRSILRFYAEYYDDRDFRFPVKNRHLEDVRIGKPEPKLKDLQEDEFHAFRKELSFHKYGSILAHMATVQFYEALRISEVAALHHEDLNLNFHSPQNSTIRVCRYIFYPRDRHCKIEIVPGFKNARGSDRSVKELYLFPEAYDSLVSVFQKGASGLVFGLDGETPFTYRQIQKAYDDAFKKAGLSYRGTHVLRHGGCRRVYNATNGDIALAQQLLGNSDLESTLVYAQRDKGALKKHVQKSWKEAQRSN